jgi:ribosome-associated protein
MPTKTTKKKPPAATHPDLLRQVALALDAKQAGDLQILHVSAQSNITDYLVIATGGSEPHLRALRVELEKVFDGAGAPIAGTDGGDGSGWTVFDGYQIMVHLFTPETRERYALDRLWKDAAAVDVPALIKPPAARKAGEESGVRSQESVGGQASGGKPKAGSRMPAGGRKPAGKGAKAAKAKIAKAKVATKAKKKKA